MVESKTKESRAVIGSVSLYHLCLLHTVLPPSTESLVTYYCFYSCNSNRYNDNPNSFLSRAYLKKRLSTMLIVKMTVFPRNKKNVVQDKNYE